MTFRDFSRYRRTEYRSERTGRALSPKAASDYASRLRTLSAALGQDIEGAAPADLRRLTGALDAHSALAAWSAKARSDAGVALRAYADFLEEHTSATPEQAAQRLAGRLTGLGFALTGELRHVLELRDEGQVVYVKRLHGRRPLVIHPDHELQYSRFASISGVSVPGRLVYYHNSSMRSFPNRLNRGEDEIHYGLDFEVSESALAPFVQVLRGQEAGPGSGPGAEPDTEELRLQKARVGQGRFRADLMTMWKECPLSGVRAPDLLRASHIKPWRHSSNAERLNPHNGLLLAVHLDCLFDKGFITFTDEGRLMISDLLSEAERRVFALSEHLPALRLRPEHLPFLRHHRDAVFLRTPGGPEVRPAIDARPGHQAGQQPHIQTHKARTPPDQSPLISRP